MKKLKISILCTDGSPLGVVPSTVYGDEKQIGVGGAELALMTMFEHWSRTHEVKLFNNPHKGSPGQYPISAFNPQEDRDILIVFRSPNPLAINAKGKKIWWSTDQHTIGNFQDFSQHMDEIVLISPRHQEYFENVYKITQTTVIDLAVRDWDYYTDGHMSIERNSKQLIYCSQPDRGLAELLAWWPEIKGRIPDAKLVITSGRKLWGNPSSGNEELRIKALGQSSIHFHGELKREELIRLQLESGVLAFPCTYDELFCIAVAESLYAGLWPVTSNKGSVATTNFNNDYRIDFEVTDPRFKEEFISRIVMAVEHEEGERMAQIDMAKERFGIDTVSAQWDEVFK